MSIRARTIASVFAFIIAVTSAFALPQGSGAAFGVSTPLSVNGLLTTLGAILSGLNSPRAATTSAYQYIGTSPELGAVGTEVEGYSTDGSSYGYIFGKLAIAKVRRADVLPGAPTTPTPLLTNSSIVPQCVPAGTASSPSTGTPNHNGAGTNPFTDPTYGEVIATPVGYYSNSTTFGSDHICLLKTNDLSVAKSIDITSGVATADGGAAGVTIIPGGGLSGGNAFGVIRFGQLTTSVWIYDYNSSVSTGTGNLLQRVAVATNSISSGQGVFYKDGLLYLMAQQYNGVSLAVNGLYTIPLPALSDCGTQASPCISSRQAVTTIQMFPQIAAPESVVYDTGSKTFAVTMQHNYPNNITNNNVYYLAPPGLSQLTTRQIDLAPDGSSLHHSVGRFSAGVTVGGDFALDYPAPWRGIRTGGAISIGCLPSYDVAPLNVCSNPQAGPAAVLHLETYRELHSANGAVAATGDTWNYGYWWTVLASKTVSGAPGSADIKLGVDPDGHWRSSGTAPTTSTSGATISGTPTNVAGAFNVPSGATQIVVTFGATYRAWDVAPACVANLDTASPVGVTETTTTATFTFAALSAAGKLRYHCIEAK